MKCDGCPFHKYEVGLEDADEWCDIFGNFPEDEKSRKDGEGCIFNMQTLKKKKAEKDEEFIKLYNPKNLKVFITIY